MSKPKVFATRLIPPKALQTLREDQRVDVEVWESNEAIPRQTLLEKAAGVEGVLVMLTDKVDEEFMKAAVVSTMSTGYDHIDINIAKTRPNLKLGYTPDVLTDCTAEITVGLLLATAHRFKEASKTVTDGTWGNWSPTWMCGMQLTGKTIGFVGFGRIGTAVAERLVPFKPAKFIYSSPSKKQRGEELHPHLFNKSTFKLMKPTSVLINTARGGIVHHDDLYDALNTGVIGSAGLDVTDPEPFPRTHPLTTLNNCTILPHIGSATNETREAMDYWLYKICLQAFLENPSLHRFFLKSAVIKLMTFSHYR
ncbi:glyoxylate reductase [Chytridium lagenaria]|nr:glyoxylate reductase [Chytridium lagenaria]